MILKIITRYVIVLVSLLALPAFVAVYLAFTRGVAAVYDHDFVVAVEIYLAFVPFTAAVFVIPNTIREYREKRDGR